MKQIILIMLLLMMSIGYAYPDLHGQRVNDFANILTPAEINDLTSQITSMETSTGAQFAIVTVPSTEGNGRVDYAARIGDQNGVGLKELDNGVVILWSLDNEKGGAIATGRGIGDILTDAEVVRIGKAHRPEFDNGQYYNAFSGILTDIKQQFPNNDSSTVVINTDTHLSPALIILIIVGILFVLFLLVALSGSDGMGGSGFVGGYVGSSGGWSGGGGSSFGGGSFGGGGGGF